MKGPTPKEVDTIVTICVAGLFICLLILVFGPMVLR